MQIILWYAQYYEAVLLCHFNQTAHSKFRWNYLLDIHIRNENKNIHTHHMGRPTKFTYHRFVHWQFFFVFHFSFFSIILFKLKTMYALLCIWLCAGTDDNWQESIVDRPQFQRLLLLLLVRLLLLSMSSCAKGSSVIIDSMTAQINWNSDICIDIIMKVHETNVCQLTIEIAWKLLMDARELRIRIRIRIRFQRIKICSALSDCHTNNASASTCATGTHWTHEMKEGKPNKKNAQRNSTCSELRCWAERAQLMRLLWME